MLSRIFERISGTIRALARPPFCAVGLALCCFPATGQGVRDLKYGVVLFEFYQHRYFETLVEYAYAAERGGIENHGDYPELLKGGVSLSYGLDLQARDIFANVIAENSPEEVQNRAWFFLAKMLYLRGDVERAARTMANIRGSMPHDVDLEYRYLAALVNIKLGYWDEAEAISRGFERDSPYAPYLYFNLGVALGKKSQPERAVANLNKAVSYADGSRQRDAVADRAHLAMAHLYAVEKDFSNAYAQISNVSATGVFSNRALLGAGWASVNNGAYGEALAPLSKLEQRSMAIPEVQEAVLLVPHVYEKLGLAGRAAQGFISAYRRYGDALVQLDDARQALHGVDMLELFVHNLDELLSESDWYGTAPSVSLNALSPFLLELMSDHSFQSVLKDLRDLYAIRNNLNGWKRKRADFDVILAARVASLDVAGRKDALKQYHAQQQELQAAYLALEQGAAALAGDERERLGWLREDAQFEIDSARMMLEQLAGAPGVAMNSDSYGRLVDSNMVVLDQELERTNALIGKVEGVLLELVKAELDIHEERLKYYRVQSHLAKARILDRSLSERELPDAGPGARPGSVPGPAAGDVARATVAQGAQ